MGFEIRGTSIYFYKKKRVGPKVMSEYLGAGYIGFLAYQLELHERKRRKLRHQTVHEIREREKDTEGSLRDYQRAVRALISACFLVNGFHNHRGQWRRLHNG